VKRNLAVLSLKGATVGRPTKLVGDVQTKVVGYIRLGLAVETACRASGVSDPTLYRWMDRGGPDAECANPEQCDLKGTHEPGECPLNVVYRDFRDAVTVAKSEFQVAMASIIVRGAQGVQKRDGQGKVVVDAGGQAVWVKEPEPRWALEMLARRAPEFWKGQVAVETTGKEGLPFIIQLVQHDRPESEVQELLGIPATVARETPDA